MQTDVSQAVFGDSLDISWIVENRGLDATNQSWRDRVWLSADAVVDASDHLLADVAAVQPLASLETYLQNVVVNLPLLSSLSAGTYFLLVQTDAAEEQPETDEANNTTVSSGISIAPIELSLVPANTVVDEPAGEFHFHDPYPQWRPESAA